MRPTAAQHPSDADLAAFALGQLDHTAIDWVSHHLDNCAACRVAVENTPADDLVDRLQKASASQASAGTASWVQGADTQSELPPSVPAHSADDLPSALRDHPKYCIVGSLGRGGMGVVYRAEHRVMERIVAVKVINRALVDNPEAVERFHREIKAAAKLDHPNIVKAYDAERAGDLQLLAMEYVEGQSLADYLKRKGPLPVAHACHYVRQAALGLQHAHEQGLVHRDLKPQNLMRTPKGVVKILDFGLAKLFRERHTGGELTHDEATMGTPEYMAPEQAQDTKSADIRADIYALGGTLFCLLAGRSPFGGRDMMATLTAHLLEAPPPLESLRPEVPAELAALVARMLAKDPAQRPQTPKEVAEALTPFVKQAAPPVEAPAAEAPTAAVRRRRPTRVVLMLGVLLASAVVVGIALKDSGDPSRGVTGVAQRTITATPEGNGNPKPADPKPANPKAVDRKPAAPVSAKDIGIQKLDEVVQHLGALRYDADAVRDGKGKINKALSKQEREKRARAVEERNVRRNEAVGRLTRAIGELKQGKTVGGLAASLEKVLETIHTLKKDANQNNWDRLVEAEQCLDAAIRRFKDAKVLPR